MDVNGANTVDTIENKGFKDSFGQLSKTTWWAFSMPPLLYVCLLFRSMCVALVEILSPHRLICSGSPIIFAITKVQLYARENTAVCLLGSAFLLC